MHYYAPKLSAFFDVLVDMIDFGKVYYNGILHAGSFINFFCNHVVKDMDMSN